MEGLFPGQRLARGVGRHLRGLDFATLLEFVPSPGLRVDVAALGPRGEIWIVECKSSRVDFVADLKWRGYLDWCDRFFWAVDETFPTDILPPDAGLIIADAWDAEVQRWPEACPCPERAARPSPCASPAPPPGASARSSTPTRRARRGPDPRFNLRSRPLIDMAAFHTLSIHVPYRPNRC